MFLLALTQTFGLLRAASILVFVVVVSVNE